ncbi:hypothetical protein T05_3002 [Trichinella murrelli]|uniref:Uncharacterized protein n=1 Tax=Trichinella murrelli TaxID=144512 RepID=A0A0V0U2G6_9BILA|nr:hypothetical protein T05_3002 [Trichinella murrelli]
MPLKSGHLRPYQHRPARWWCDQTTPFVVYRRVKRKLAVACGAARGWAEDRSGLQISKATLPQGHGCCGADTIQELEKPNGKFDPRKRAVVSLKALTYCLFIVYAPPPPPHLLIAPSFPRSSVGRSDNGQLTVLCDTDRLTTKCGGDRPRPNDNDAEANRRPRQTCALSPRR